uniref:DUF4283 domain-containing protein n=1 Tax=Quercus lobata TaxID=97700 RepID=A0A7N2MD97_QUELO
MGNHVVLFIFDNMFEVERIIENQPWNFDKHLVVMEKFEESSKLNELTFDKAWFWVQVHDIPVHFMSKQVAENICDIIGEVHRLPESIEDDGGKFIRVCVRLDINLSLCRGRVIMVENVWIQSRGTLTSKQKQFDPHLRAEPFQSRGKMYFFVPRIFYKEVPKTMKTKVAEVNNGVPMEVGVHGSDTVEMETGRADSEEAETHNEVTTSYGKQSMMVDLGKETEKLNSHNSTISKIPPPNNSGLALNESNINQKTVVIDMPINCHDSGSFNVEALAPTLINQLLPTQVTNVPRDDNNPIPQATMFTSKQSNAHKATDPRSSKPVGNSNEISPPTGKWTRLLRAQTSTPSHHGSLETIALGKRSVDDSRSPMEVTNKRLQVSMENDQQSQILAEDVSQPCQKQ